MRIIESADNQFQEFLNGVDYGALNKHVSDLIGTEVNLEPQEVKDGKYLRLEDSRNFADKCGVMSLVYKDVTINTFNGRLLKDEDGQYYYWCSICFSFNYKSGGSNSTNEICDAWYKNGSWQFRGKV